MKNLFIAAICLFMLLACGEKENKQAALPEVKYICAREYDLPLTVDLPGRVSAITRSEVRPQVDGIIRQRLFEEGADVVEGQQLYQIDEALYKADYETARADLEEAEARASLTGQHEARQRNLARAKAVSQQDLENAISENRQARARLARARAELERAKINLDYTKILAHASGRIGVSAVSPGSLVIARQENPLAIIQRIDQVYVDMSQSGADFLGLRQKLANSANKAKIGLKLENGTDYTSLKNGEKIWGKPLFTDISVSQDTGSLNARALFDNPDGLLLPGAYVTATVEYGISEKALLLPQKCVLSGVGSAHYVYVLKPGPRPGTFITEYRPVTIGHPYGNFWIIEAGLEPGDLVVAEGLQKIEPGKEARGEALEQDRGK